MNKGRFGIHGGQYIPETLMNAIMELEEAYDKYKDDPEFNRELTELYNEYAGRPSRLYFAKRMTEDLGGAKIYLKREDLNHTGSHKINNVLGQMLLAKKMGKTRVIAETGAGQHGVATATVAAMMGMECEIFMGKMDCERQALNVYRMKLLGAKVHPVEEGTKSLKDAVSATFREWTRRIDDTHYVLGSVMGPYPFPGMVRDFQAVISREIKRRGYVLSRTASDFQKEHGREPRLSELCALCGMRAEEIAEAMSAQSPLLSLERTDEEDSPPLEALIGEDPSEKMTESIALHEALRTLPSDERALVFLRYFRCMTQSESARVLGLTQVTVSRREKKIMEKLRAALSE